jgi:hypothetical protein
VVCNRAHQPLGKIEISFYASTVKRHQDSNQYSAASKVSGQTSQKGKKAKKIEQQKSARTGVPAVHETELVEWIPAEIDRTSYSPEIGGCDLAVIHWQETLPPEVTIARLKTGKVAPGTNIWTKGFPELGPVHGQTATGSVMSTEITNWGDIVQVQLTACVKGFSGAPVWDAEQRVIGMVVLSQDQVDAGAPAVFIVPTDTHRRYANWLGEPAVQPNELDAEQRAAREAAVKSRLKQAQEDLRETMIQCLRQSAPAYVAIATQFGMAPAEPPDDKSLGKLVDHLLSEPPQTCAVGLSTVHSSFRKSPSANTQALASVVDLYLAFMPAIVNRHSGADVQLLLQGLYGLHDEPIVIPTSSKTVLALYLAALDGAPVVWDWPSASRKLPTAQHVIDDLPESSFQTANMNTPVLVKHLAQRVGGGLTLLPADEEVQVGQIQSALEYLHQTKRTQGVISARDLTPEQDVAIRRKFQYLALVRLDQKKLTHYELINPFQFGDLLPPAPPSTP